MPKRGFHISHIQKHSRLLAHLRNVLPIVLFGIELDHVAVNHLPDLSRAVPVAAPHAIAFRPKTIKKEEQKGYAVVTKNIPPREQRGEEIELTQ